MSPSIQDGPIEGEQLIQLTQYTRTHSGGRYKFIKFVAASRGRANIHSWVKDYLSEEKEELYLRALRNLYRKLDFMELNQSLEMSDISEDEFDKELETHEDKYLIPAPSGTPSQQQIIQITDILKRLGRENSMSVDEVSEMFSLEMDKAMGVLQGK
ncbi:MAG: hypothetical protein IKO62_05985 [Bacteroidales bacterium]|nr:hypothetical protein [Bacteroidales bacterium]